MRGKCDKNVANTLPRVIGNCGELKDNLLLHGICTVAFSQNLNYRRRKKNTFSKLFLRKPVFTVVLTLLLTFAVGFSCIGFSAYATAYEQRIMIEKDYTSIALPAPKRVLQYKTEDGAVMYYEDDTFAYDFDRIEAVAKNAPQYKRSSNSGFLPQNRVFDISFLAKIRKLMPQTHQIFVTYETETSLFQRIVRPKNCRIIFHN